VTRARRGGLSRHALAGALLAAALVGLAFALVAGLGGSAPDRGGRGHMRSVSSGEGAPSSSALAGVAHRAGTPSSLHISGAGAAGGTRSTHAARGGSAAALSPTGATVAEVRDPEESRSFPLPASVHHRAASTPSVAAEAVVAPGAASDAQIRRELHEEEHAKAQERALSARALKADTSEGGSSVGGNGTIPIPSNLPEVVQRVIAGGNAIADFPYIWGGGHGSFVDHGYDCSGSVSYALAAGGLLSAPLVSGDLASWGEPGPGRWITIYANAGHTFMNVAGMWFDTAGRSGPYASRWILATPPLAGYAVRHPPGL
jgi:cell wall-associated NlpC family hydrolase